MLLIAALGGCVGSQAEVSRASGDPAVAPIAAPALDRKGVVSSSLIEDLSQRRSILPKGSAYAAVAQAVLEANSGAAEAELRVARLTAKAKSKNWLPSIGPNVSLSSLGALAASLVLDQALFDNGRRKAERSFAAADVEVAAVSLAEDVNKRVYDGLRNYIEAQRATELSRLTETALVRMRDFDRIMRIRVEGGLSDRSEYRVVSQKLAEMEAVLSQEKQAAATAWAELAAMSSGDLTTISGLTPLQADPGAPEPLSVLAARGEAARTRAQVQMARAGLRPGFGAEATVDRRGGVDAGLVLDGEGLGFGRMDNMKALDETEQAAARRVDEAEETARRRIVALEREIASLTDQERQQGEVLAQMTSNLDLFTEQYRAGRRSLIELVGQFESLVRMQQDQASLKYQISVARLEIAQVRGVLVDGAAL